MLVHSLASKYARFVVIVRQIYWTPPSDHWTQWRIQYFGREGAPRGDRKKFVVDNVVAPKARRCVAQRATPTRGVRGHAPPEHFYNFNAKWFTLEAF